VSLNARQLVWDFGATGFQVDSRLAQELSVQARAQAKRSELTLRALNAWLDLFRAQQLVQAGRMNVLSREQILDFIKEREQLGASAMSDVLRAQARLADAQAAAVAAANRLAAAEAVWREFFDSEPPADPALPVVPDLPDAPSDALASTAVATIAASPPAAPATPVGLDAQAPARWADASPILAEARRQAEAAQAEARAAAAAVLPSVSFDVSVRRRDLGSGNTPGTDWNAGLSVSQSLFNGGAATARAQQAQQRAREAQLAETNLRRQLERALAQTLSDVRNSTTAVKARKDAAQVAAVALEAVREQFAFRRGSLLDLLRAQEELHQATRDLIDSVVDQTLARYRLLHLASDLAPRFGVPVDAPAPVLPPSLLFPDPPSPFRDDQPAASLTRQP
jgi:outer membrane protein